MAVANQNLLGDGMLGTFGRGLLDAGVKNHVVFALDRPTLTWCQQHGLNGFLMSAVEKEVGGRARARRGPGAGRGQRVRACIAQRWGGGAWAGKAGARVRCGVAGASSAPRGSAALLCALLPVAVGCLSGGPTRQRLGARSTCTPCVWHACRAHAGQEQPGRQPLRVRHEVWHPQALCEAGVGGAAVGRGHCCAAGARDHAAAAMHARAAAAAAVPAHHGTGSHPMAACGCAAARPVSAPRAHPPVIPPLRTPIVRAQNPFKHLYRDSDVEGMSDGWDEATAYGAIESYQDKSMGWSQWAQLSKHFNMNRWARGGRWRWRAFAACAAGAHPPPPPLGPWRARARLRPRAQASQCSPAACRLPASVARAHMCPRSGLFYMRTHRAPAHARARAPAVACSTCAPTSARCRC